MPRRHQLDLALFREISHQLVNLITDPQEGFWDDAPQWLHRLIRLWHRRQVAVVTFNYDTIVEESVVQLDPPHAQGDIVSAMLTHIPRLAVTGLAGSGVVMSTYTSARSGGSAPAASFAGRW